ncbi:hypothetical protein KC19_VG022200 [Ceratodon purpureus]|uniref:Uncharacterized protein n=1 Tax=Ceratodon purpureus TaxID=3225 RepID=A0A8T0HL65_CERPU|nr:hypothetical protein KC19_VG022200 [Ceratodon purpureus]
MQEHRTEDMRQRAVWMVDRVLRNGNLARQISGDPHVHTALVNAFRYGNNSGKQLAEKALKQLNKIPNFSGVFQVPSRAGSEAVPQKRISSEIALFSVVQRFRGC